MLILGVGVRDGCDDGAFEVGEVVFDVGPVMGGDLRLSVVTNSQNRPNTEYRIYSVFEK